MRPHQPKYDYEDLKKRAGAMTKRLAKIESDEGGDRATLAALRHGLRTKNGVCLEAMPFVSEFLADHDWPSKDRWFFAVATLFALHSQNHDKYQSIGADFGQLRSESDSIEKRFQLMLSCDEDDLFEHLIQLVSLLKSKSIPVNWFRLLHDLTRYDWDDDDRELQLKWARDFYKTTTPTPSS